MRLYSYNNDIGIKKKVNQDSILIKEAGTADGDITLLVVCDGMGGLSSGEVASARAIRAFDEWFDNKLAYALGEDDVLEAIKREWDYMIKDVSQNIMDYGDSIDVQLGTTCSALLILDDDSYLIAHVGDTRVYRFDENNLEILTTDHTVIAKEIRYGKLTPEEAKTDPRRNMLLQAIGASEYIEIDMLTGKVKPGETYMICSDGFRHKLSEEELIERFCIEVQAEAALERIIHDSVELVKKRGEVDNISCIAIKIYED